MNAPMTQSYISTNTQIYKLSESSLSSLLYEIN